MESAVSTEPKLLSQMNERAVLRVLQTHRQSSRAWIPCPESEWIVPPRNFKRLDHSATRPFFCQLGPSSIAGKRDEGSITVPVINLPGFPVSRFDLNSSANPAADSYNIPRKQGHGTQAFVFSNPDTSIGFVKELRLQ